MGENTYSETYSEKSAGEMYMLVREEKKIKQRKRSQHTVQHINKTTEMGRNRIIDISCTYHRERIR